MILFQSIHSRHLRLHALVYLVEVTVWLYKLLLRIDGHFINLVVIITWVDANVVTLLSKLEAFLSRKEELESFFEVSSRLDYIDDVDLPIHHFKSLVNTSLCATLAAALTLLRDQVHQIMADIAESHWFDEVIP